MSDVIKKCIEFVLISLLMLIAGVLVIFAGACMIVFSPVVALWELMNNYEETGELVE